MTENQHLRLSEPFGSQSKPYLQSVVLTALQPFLQSIKELKFLLVPPLAFLLATAVKTHCSVTSWFNEVS